MISLMDIRGKIAVVAGATGGIGEELCKELDNEGAQLILIARSEDKLKKLIESLKNKNHAYITFDFTKTEKLKDLEKKLTKIKVVDILFNTAGIGVYKFIEDVSFDDWQDSFDINVTAPYFVTKILLPKLLKSKKAVVINVGSGMGKIPTPGRSVYCATKFALRGLSLSLSEEFKDTHIHFVHIDLGSTLTDFGPMTLKEKQEENLKGKAYFTPVWVAKKFIHIIRYDELEEEITLYPSDYTEK